MLATFRFRSNDEIKIDDIKDSLKQAFLQIDLIKSNIQKFSSIEDVRYTSNFNIFMNEEKDKITINNIFLEFQIDGDWLPFSSLSDGTKRIFYILSEVSSPSNLYVNSNEVRIFYETNEEISRIILIEEPELGIHPHQFHKLMQFLKEYSATRQIVISTHSPQSLDILKEDELNAIIIAFNSHDSGTLLRHLSDLELAKAKIYIENEFLSDYWRLSDLEK